MRSIVNVSIDVGVIQAIEKIHKNVTIKFTANKHIIFNNDANEGGIQVLAVSS